jgi:hypothetical protein
MIIIERKRNLINQEKIKRIANIMDSKKKMIETNEISVSISFVEEFIKNMYI